MCLFVIIDYFICASIFQLSLLVLAYVDMQRHSKTDLSLVVQYSRTRYMTTIRSYSLVSVNNTKGQGVWEL